MESFVGVAVGPFVSVEHGAHVLSRLTEVFLVFFFTRFSHPESGVDHCILQLGLVARRDIVIAYHAYMHSIGRSWRIQ